MQSINWIGIDLRSQMDYCGCCEDMQVINNFLLYAIVLLKIFSHEFPWHDYNHTS